MCHGDPSKEAKGREEGRWMKMICNEDVGVTDRQMVWSQQQCAGVGAEKSSAYTEHGPRVGLERPTASEG